MGEKVIMLGNAAIARGAYEAGVKVSAAYPGTPSTEISENLVQYRDSLYCEWSPNEKVAIRICELTGKKFDDIFFIRNVHKTITE